MDNNYPYYQPMDQLGYLRNRPYQPPQQSGAPIWVQGEAGARAYMVAPGATVLLMDSDASTMYLKGADASGRPYMRTFDLVERTAAPAPQSAPQFVSRAEFDEFKAKLESMLTSKEENNA